jgi:chromatin segregation and condensation protein Rec8/ScpA/Scc1 (kleisin family)
MLLFLAIQGKITLQQDQEFGDISIRVCEAKPTFAA